MEYYTHVVVIPPDGEREAAFDLWICCLEVRVAQCTASEHCFLCLIESNSTELFPVADKLIFDDDLVDRKFTLTTY